MEPNNNILNEACLSGNIDLVKVCLSASRVNITNNDNKPLINAVYGNNIDIVQLLLSDIRPDPSARNNRCIKVAIENGNLPIVKMLMNDWRVSLDEMAYKLLYTVTKDNREELIAYITQNDKSIDAERSIMLSIIDNDIHKFIKLLPSVDINARNGQVLTVACNMRRSEIIKLVLADSRLIIYDNQLPLVVLLDISILEHISDRDVYNRLLNTAVKSGLEDTARYLLKMSTNVDIAGLCRLACVEGRLEIFKMLHNPELSEYYLAIACENNHINIVKFLLSYRECDVSLGNNKALFMAISRGCNNIVELLLQDERLRVIPDDECIDIAVSGNRVAILRMLLQDGRFDPAVNDNWSLKLASEKGYEECVNLLLDDIRVISSM